MKCVSTELVVDAAVWLAPIKMSSARFMGGEMPVAGRQASRLASSRPPARPLVQGSSFPSQQSASQHADRQTVSLACWLAGWLAGKQGCKENLVLREISPSGTCMRPRKGYCAFLIGLSHRGRTPTFLIKRRSSLRLRIDFGQREKSRVPTWRQTGEGR